jgi:hypothetical protein
VTASEHDDVMSLSVKMSGENVADLSVAIEKNDTEMGSHA